MTSYNTKIYKSLNRAQHLVASAEQVKQWKTISTKNKRFAFRADRKIIAKLHSTLFDHDYVEPCSCDKEIWGIWIKDINKIIDVNI